MRVDVIAAALSAIVLGLAAATGAVAQIATGTERVGDSASLSAGVPITAPDTVDAGTRVAVTVPDAPAGARIELWGPVTQKGKGTQLAAVPLAGNSAELVAPERSGSYELRYLGRNGAQLGRRAFDVAAVPVVLTVPTPVAAGGTVSVRWQGPAGPGDRFEIVGPGGAVLGTAPVAGSAARENVSELRVPQQTGPLELRYVTGSGAVLRSVSFDAAGIAG